MDYADDLALLANSSAQAESQVLSLEGEAGGIGHHFNTDQNRIHVL